MSRKRRRGSKKRASEPRQAPRPQAPIPTAPPPLLAPGASPSSHAEAVDRVVIEAFEALSPIFLTLPGTESPLSGIRCQLWTDLERQTEHWILVTYGLAPSLGFELTLRVPKGHQMELQPPRWSLLLLTSLSDFADQLQRPFVPGNRINLGGPISLEDPTRLRAAAFVKEPVIETLEGEFPVKFVQVVGLSGPELEAGSSWDLNQLMDLILERIPLGVTEVERECLLETDPALRRIVQEGIEREGSTEEAATVDVLEWKVGEGLTLTLGALAINLFQGLLKGRTRHGRGFELFDPKHQVTICPGEEFAFEKDPKDKHHLTLTLPESHVARLVEELKSVRGTYPMEGWTVKVVESVITDERGRPIERVG
jgi:suppressor of fused